MTANVPFAHNHWALALATRDGAPEDPFAKRSEAPLLPLLLASPPMPLLWSPAGPRHSPETGDPRSRVALLLAAELGSTPVRGWANDRPTRTFQAVEEVIETAVWLTSRSRGA
ncbi:MAG TPA: hypothetical protein VIU15_27780 [Streptomyces sp.]